MRDPIVEGQYYSLDFIKAHEIDLEKSFIEEFDFEFDSSKTAQAAGVYNIGQTDTSQVYRVIIKNRDILFVTKEYDANQTGTEIIAAPGAGKRIVINYGSVRVDATSGTAYLHGTTWKAFVLYATRYDTIQAGSLVIKCDPNTAVQYTSTVGINDQFIALNYYIEAV